MLTVLCFGLCLLGLVAIALAMDRHHDLLLQRPVRRHLRRALRAAGAALQVTSLIGATASEGGSRGVLLWLGWVTLAALLVTAGITWRSGVSRR